MITLFTIIMLTMTFMVVWGCLEQRKAPNSLLEWVILIVTAFLLVSNLR